jgi:hypothetical protein
MSTGIRKSWSGRKFLWTVAKNTAALLIYFGGFYTLFALSFYLEPKSDDLPALYVLGITALLLLLVSLASFAGWLVIFLRDSRRAASHLARVQAATIDLRSGAWDQYLQGTDQQSLGRIGTASRGRASESQTARPANWQEYFWAVFRKTARVFLASVAIVIPLFFTVVNRHEPNDWLDAFASCFAGCWILVAIGTFLIGVPALLGWLWCLVLSWVGSAGRFALRSPPVLPQERPQASQDKERGVPPHQTTDHIWQKEQFSPGLQRHCSEEMQE